MPTLGQASAEINAGAGGGSKPGTTQAESKGQGGYCSACGQSQDLPSPDAEQNVVPPVNAASAAPAGASDLASGIMGGVA